MLSPAGKIYVSEDVEIDTGRVTVRRGGDERSLRPKTFRLLLYLIEHRGRLVPKEELIEHVWQDTAVSDGALAQCVADIRRALGEDSRNPRFIRTAARLGYQFIGPVEESTSRSLILEEITEERFEYSEEIIENEPAVLDYRPAALLPAPRVAWRRMAIYCGLTMLVGVAALAAWRYLPRSPAALEPGIRTAVFQFENRSGKPEMDWLRVGLADMLATSLSGSPRIALITPGQLQRGLGQPLAATVNREDALRAARHAGAKAFVLGAFGSLGETVRLDTQIYEVSSGRLLGGESITVEKPQLLLAQIDPLAAKLAVRLGVPIAAQTHLAEVTTNNLEAYRLYSLGVERTRALRLPEAIGLYEKAVELDPAFAMAYARMGYTYSSAWARPAEGKPYLEKAFGLSGRLTPRDRLFIRAWYAMASQDYESAERAYREILAAFPLEVEVYLSLATLVKGDRRPDEARQILERGLNVDPAMPDIHNLLAFCYLEMQQQDSAIRSAQRYVALSNEPNAHDSLGSVYQAFGRYGEARDAYLQALRQKPDFELAIIHLGNLYFQTGRYRDALEQYAAYIRLAPSDIERYRGHSGSFWVYWKKGDLSNAEAESRAARHLPDSQVETLLLAADRGDQSSAEEVGRQLFSAHPYALRGARENRRIRLFAAGQIALRNHRTDEALDHFRAALQEPSIYWYVDPLETCLADALLELGRADEAIAEYKRILSFNPNYAMARYRLGLALERKGLTAESRTELRHFLTSWKDADSDVPEWIDARKRLGLAQ